MLLEVPGDQMCTSARRLSCSVQSTRAYRAPKEQKEPSQAGFRGAVHRLENCKDARTSRRLLLLLPSGLGSGPKLTDRVVRRVRCGGEIDASDPPPSPGLPPPPPRVTRARVRAARPEATPVAAAAAAAKAAVRGLIAAADIAAADPGVGCCCCAGEDGAGEAASVSGCATGLTLLRTNLFMVPGVACAPRGCQWSPLTLALRAAEPREGGTAATSRAALYVVLVSQQLEAVPAPAGQYEFLSCVSPPSRGDRDLRRCRAMICAVVMVRRLSEAEPSS